MNGLDGQEAALDSGMLPTDDGYGITDQKDWGLLSLGQSTRNLTTERVATENGNYPAFYRGVVAAVRGDGPVPVDPRESLEVVRIIERIHREFPAA